MENSALLIKLKEEKRVSISYQARRHDAWTDIYNLYRDIVETNELTQRQDVNIPIMKETKKTLLSRVDEPPDVIFDCLQKDIAGREKEMVINELWDQDSDTCNFAGVDIIEKNSVLLYGRAFKKLNVIDGVFMVEVPNKLDVVIDPKVNPLDIETAKFIVHLHIYKYLRDILADPKYDEDGKQDLKKVLQEGSDEQGQGQLIQFSKDKTQEAKDEVLKNLGIDNFEEFGAADVLVELNEQFTQIWDEEQKKFVRYVVVVADDNAILFKKPLKEVLGVDFWPFVSWADDVDNEDFWTDGMGDVVRTPNKIMNIYFSTMLENRVYQNLGMMWYLPTPGFDPQTFEPEPFGMYPAPMIEDSSGRLLTIEQVVKQMDIPALRDNLVEIEFLIKLVERATAATAIEKGIGEKKQITLGEVEELVAKSAERITSMAKFYRRAWKEFAWKWRKLKEENALAKSPITLYKKTYRGNYFEKKVYKKDWYSKEGYKERVLSSSEQAAEKKGELEKLMALGQQYPNDPVIQKIVKKRMLDTFDLTPDEMKEIKDAEKAAEVVPIPEVSVDQSQGEEERKLTEGIRRGVGELSTLT